MFYLIISFLVELLAVGSCKNSKDETVKTEMYSTEVGRWETAENYPYDSESKNYYIILYFFWFVMKPTNFYAIKQYCIMAVRFMYLAAKI